MEAKNAFKVLGLFILWGALIAVTWAASTPGPDKSVTPVVAQAQGQTPAPAPVASPETK